MKMKQAYQWAITVLIACMLLAMGSQANAAVAHEKQNIHVVRDYVGNGINCDIVDWNEPDTDFDIEGYELRYSVDGKKTWVTYEVDPDQTFWTHEDDADGCVPEKDTHYQVRTDFGDEGYGPWSYTVYVKWIDTGPIFPFTHDIPQVTGHREFLANGNVNDTISWSEKPEEFEVVGYKIRYFTYYHDGIYHYVDIDDPTVQTWSFLDDGGLELNGNTRRFHVAYLVEYNDDVIASRYSNGFYFYDQEDAEYDFIWDLVPQVTVKRTKIPDGSGVIDTVSWNKHPDHKYVDHYTVQWEEENGQYGNRLIWDKNKTTWNNLQGSGKPWSNTVRKFWARYSLQVVDAHYTSFWSDVVIVGPDSTNPPPTPPSNPVALNITATPSTTVAHNQTVVLAAEVSDLSQVAFYQWSHVGGWHDMSKGAAMTLAGPGWPNGPGTRTFKVVVVLNDGSIVTEEQSITFTNPPNDQPVANPVTLDITVIPSTTVAHNQTVALTAEVSDLSQVASYQWSHVGGWHDMSKGAAMTLAGPGWPNGPGTRTFKVVVTLNDGSTVTEEQSITFTNP